MGALYQDAAPPGEEEDGASAPRGFDKARARQLRSRITMSIAPRLALALVLLGGLGSAFAACATGVTSPIGEGEGGSGGASASATVGSGGGATTAAASTSGSGGSGFCTSAAECTSLTDACNVGTCVNGSCVPFAANEGVACDDATPCTSATCVSGLCTGSPTVCPDVDACHPGACDPATEQCLNTPIVQCLSGDGCCPGGCDFAADADCAPPTSFLVLDKKDVTYNGIDYLALKVSMLSAQSVAADWCYEYQNLCASFGYVPTGCGQTYTSMANGYGLCKTQYGSDGVSDSLGCNPSSGIAAAAQQVGWNDATGENSFGFHYCDAGTCSKTMCSGQYCNTSLSYIDMTKPHGYTLCKK